MTILPDRMPEQRAGAIVGVSATKNFERVSSSSILADRTTVIIEPELRTLAVYCFSFRHRLRDRQYNRYQLPTLTQLAKPSEASGTERSVNAILEQNQKQGIASPREEHKAKLLALGIVSGHGPNLLAEMREHPG
jgi:hypothetical protein